MFDSRTVMKERRAVAQQRFLVPVSASGLWAILFLACASQPAIAEDSATLGSFRLSNTLAAVVGDETAERVSAVIPVDQQLTWEVYVPESYDDANPPGMMVYISPGNSGKIPRGWKAVLEEKNLIWIAANRSGNKAAVARRAIVAVVGPTLIEKQYNIDRDRIYVSGLSGGGKMASMVATDNAHLFKGAIYNCGVNFWDADVPDRINLIRQNHFVFVTGTLDFALEPTKKAYKQYKDAGVENALLMVVRGMNHKNPGRSKFAEAIDYLDSRIDQE